MYFCKFPNVNLSIDNNGKERIQTIKKTRAHTHTHNNNNNSNSDILKLVCWKMKNKYFWFCYQSHRSLALTVVRFIVYRELFSWMRIINKISFVLVLKTHSLMNRPLTLKWQYETVFVSVGKYAIISAGIASCFGVFNVDFSHSLFLWLACFNCSVLLLSLS